MSELNQTCKEILFGVAVGDALGVPVEFLDRAHLKANPVTDMTGYGTHQVPAGTFSDDSSMSFCLAEALTGEFSLQLLASNFVSWLFDNYWTANGEVFDVGIATNQAIRKLKQGCEPVLAGGSAEADNGNGSLMRILPLVPYVMDLPINERFEIIRSVSSLTHAHIRSVIACFYYVEFAMRLIKKADKFTAYVNTASTVKNYLKEEGVSQHEISIFDRLLNADISTQTEETIFSSGYVLHTLEASIWCLLTSDNYCEAVLKAVNLGQDTDTTAAVTGGLAALAFGFDNIPSEWIQLLARKDDIADLADRLAIKFSAAT